ncbi:MAG: glycosyltransferase [Puniceicoccaceae bacterium]|nr:MAG: glycosyltransferase [Puniceicoccaceae bacterium]
MPAIAPPSTSPAPAVSCSVVIPLFNEARTLPELWRRLRAVMDEAAPGDWEVVFIDDGSSDDTPRILADLVRAHREVTALRLSRNFGQQNAVSAGLQQARGRAVIMMDGDLQDEPEAIPRLLEKWREGYRVVYAVRAGRDEPFPRRVAFKLFYRIQRLLSGVDMPLDSGLFSVLDRQAADQLARFSERNRYLPGLRAFIGLRQIGVPIQRAARFEGRPRVTTLKLLKLAADAIFSFSLLPLRLVSLSGLFLAAASFVLGVVALGYRLATGRPFLDWPFGLTTAALVAGLLLLNLGIIAEYLGRIYDEVKNRPVFVVAEIWRHEEKPEPPAAARR